MHFRCIFTNYAANKKWRFLFFVFSQRLQLEAKPKNSTANMVLGSSERRDFGIEKYAGVLLRSIDPRLPAEQLVDVVRDVGFDFVVLPVQTDTSAPRLLGRAGLLSDGSAKPPMRPDTHLYTMISEQVSNRVVALVSDTADRDLQLMELEWAAHLTCQACIVPLGITRDVEDDDTGDGGGGAGGSCGRRVATMMLAQMLGTFLHGGGANTTVWVRIPACNRKHGKMWEVWHAIRMHCNHPRNLGVVLEVGALDALEDVEENLGDGMMGEPLRAVIVPLKHERGDAICRMALERGLQVIVDPCEGAGSCTPDALRAVHMRLSHIMDSRQVLSEEDILEMPYWDFLQAPLQPLQDDLASQTYETFERDSPKYVAYEEAVYHALCSIRETSEAGGVPGWRRDVDVCVVGAGRGPLVSAVLRASVRAEVPTRVVAVEKNRNAVVHVLARAEKEGWDEERVRVVHADMRAWTPDDSYLADILVSELLGSFGDNELSPECLDGAQRFLRPGGCSIPTSYTSFLSPITAAKVWSEVATRDAAISVGSIKNLETPFVVRLHEFREIDSPKPVFTFHHPSKPDSAAPSLAHGGGSAPARTTGQNERTRCNIRFVNAKPYPVVCHGFAGYFTACLWGDTSLSIHPEHHTKDMYSWFPIFFPAIAPFTVEAGGTIEISMFRRSSTSKVWYEWTVSRPVALPMANPSGRSYHVGL